MNTILGRQNVTIGQFQEFAIQLDESLIFKFLDKFIIIQDQNNNPQMKFSIDGGYLKYQLWDGNTYLPPQTITTPTISGDDSTTLPHTPANTYISIDNAGFKVIINLIESLLYFNNTLSINMQDFLINNELADLSFKFKQQFGQVLYFKEYDTNNNILHISSNVVNLYNKQLKGLQNATDLTDAVTLQQLQNVVPNTLKVRLPDTQIHLKNSLDNDIINIDNTRLESNVYVQYTSHPNITNNFIVPDWQNVLTQLTQYQQVSQKNQANGYAGIDISGYVTDSVQRPEILRLDASIVKTYGSSPITTDNVNEGSVNHYFTQQRVLDVLTSQKGQVNGIASLDSDGLIPSSQLPPLQIGVTFTGLDSQKTNPAQYPNDTPIVGDRYIATDIGIQYVLSALPYTNNANWIQLSNGGVDSVNTKVGTVSLTTDDIPEGIDRYFASGIVDYKLNNANNPNELLKLDGAGLLDTNLIPSTLKLNNGSIQLVDNQINELDVQNSLNSNSILSLQRTQVVSSVPLINNGVSISNNNQYVDKSYVDASIIANIPIKIQRTNTQIQANNLNIQTTVNNFNIRTDEESKTTQNTPIFYDSLVPVTSDQQLATKKYVDDILSAFIQNSGVSKEFLQAYSNVSINVNGRITGWSVDVQSQTKQRLDIGLNDTFNVIAGVYRFYIGMKIKEFSNSGLMNIAIIVRDVNTLQEYMLFDFRTIVDTSGGDQEFTMSQPYLWKLDNSANIEVYAQIGNTSYNIYESYLMIEEVEKYGVELGRDRITDPTLSSVILATNNYLNFNINGTEYGKMQNNTLTFEPNIKVKYDTGTLITNDYDLTTKKYVDTAVNNSTKSITDLGQMFEAVLSADQITLLTAGNQVRFNTQSLNTTSTITMDGVGNITLTHGFIYQISVSLAVQFSGTSGFVILSFKNFNTGISIPSSKLYIVTQPSSNSTQSSVSFFMDLRSEISPQQYSYSIDSSLRLSAIYYQYTRFTCEQKQIISSQIWDRIQSESTDTRIRVFNEGIEQTIDGQVLQTTTNDSSNIVNQLNVDNSVINTKSTADSLIITQNVQNTNIDNMQQRQSTLQTDVNNEVSSIMTSIVTNSISGNQKKVIIGGIDSDTLQICSTDPDNPQVTLFSPGQLQNIPLQISVKTGYDSNITVDQQYQFTSKKYVDDSILNASVPLNQVPAPLGNVDLANYKITSLGNATVATDALNRQTGDGRYYANTVTLNNIIIPNGNLSLNSYKITNLATPTANTDAATKQYVDSNGGISKATADTYYFSFANTTLPTTSLNMNSQNIQNLATPLLTTDAATKSYVDSLSIQPGFIAMWCKTTPPAGYLICDGSSYNTVTYAALFAVLGTSTLPDFRGKFVRGYDSTNIYDPDSRTILSTQLDAYENHVHQVTTQTFNTASGGAHTHRIRRRDNATTSGLDAIDNNSGAIGTQTFFDDDIVPSGGAHTHSIVIPTKDTDVSTSGSSESRPVNICLLYVIKY